MTANAELRGIAVVPRKNTAEPLFSFEFALIGRSEINIKNVITNISSLMRSLAVVVLQPFPVDVIKMVQAKAMKAVQIFGLNFTDIALRSMRLFGDRIDRVYEEMFSRDDFHWAGVQLASYGLALTETTTLADTDGDGLTNLEEYLAGKNPLVNDSSPDLRVTEYYLTTGDFSGTTAVVTLDQALADDYYILVRGSRTGDGKSHPDNNYARVTAVPDGQGELAASGALDQIQLGRYIADVDWEGVVTVVECGNAASAAGFKLVDIVATSLAGTSGADTSAAWNDVNQVVLFGGYRGGGASLVAATTSSRNQGSSVYVRLYPSGTGTLNWSRDAAGETLVDAVMTTFVVEWGSEWDVQHVNVAGSNGGGSADVAGEYTTSSITATARDNTWIWATGTRADAGIGDCAEGCLVTLGDGVSQNTTESSVAVGSEYTDAYDFDVYVLTHSDIAVDYRFVVDGNKHVLDLPVTVDTATAGSRFGWVYNGLAGTGDYHPRSLFWARYTSDSEVTISRGFDGQNFPAWVQGIDFSGLNN